MPTLGNTPRPAYVYDTETDTWVPIGVGAHTHDYIANTLVDAKGDLISATADNVPARLAAGNNGETLVADSSATTGLRWQGAQAAGKNLIVNGSFDIWQRGTASSTASGAYGADRWYSYTATNVNYQRETLGVGSATTYGIKYTSTSGTNSVLFGTALEDVVANQIRGQNVTLSFYAYCSTGTVSLISYIQKNSTANNATVGSWSTISNPTNTVTTTAQRFTVSNVAIAADSTTAGIRILFGADNFTNGANFVIYGVQLEIGAVATPFTRAGGTLAGELAACQRYYWRAGGLNVYQHFGLGIGATSTIASIMVNNPVTMRIAATAVDYSTLAIFDGTTLTGSAVPTIVSSYMSNNISVVDATVASGVTVNRPYKLISNNSTSGYIGFSAEL